MCSADCSHHKAIYSPSPSPPLRGGVLQTISHHAHDVPQVPITVGHDVGMTTWEKDRLRKAFAGAMFRITS